ncbi:MAG: 8-amino-7-oxononanoate synthase [Candidatus Saganbacteria bacterium]|nr:8-amino-7-oxononanoate synthase [Candidatus Saganbacteria bacterium]
MNFIDDLLKQRKEDNNFRTLDPVSSRNGCIITVNGKEYIDFSSNDYLGLSGHPEMIKAVKEAAEKWGTGSASSRLLSGDNILFHELEEKTAVFKSKEASLVFNSGYQANTGIISALYSKEDVIFADKLVHASIIDGILLSGAKMFRFSHNDTGHLKELLIKNRKRFKNALIVTESVFSMDGDTAPLKELAAIKNENDCMLMADEAHATGIFGDKGSGMVEREGVSESVELVMGTFSKALGSFGAYLACSKKIKEYLVNTCRSFIYSTALPPAVIAANLKSLELVKKEPERRKKLLELSVYFKKQIEENGFEVRSTSQIIPVVIGENEEAVKVSKKLKEKGFRAMPVRYPTVPKGQARIRFSLSSLHTKEMIDEALNALK